jgi:hypothetical protein
MLEASGIRRIANGRRLLILASMIVVGLWAYSPSIAHASGCQNSWTNASGGSWYTAANWSKKALPASGEEACVTLNGTYTVTMTQGEAPTLKALTVGGTSGKQTLEVNGQCGTNAVLTTTSGLTTHADGAVSLGAVSCGASATLAGPVANGGTLTSAVGDGEGSRYLNGSLTNTGTLAIAYNASFEASKAVLTNDGALTIANGTHLTLENESSAVNGAGGSIAGGTSGYLLVQPKTAFTEGAGTTSGTEPVLIKEGALSYTGSGASTIAIRDASTLSGNLAAGQTLNLQGECGEDTRVEASASFTNAGAITLGSGGCGSYETLETLSGTLTNTGSITTAAADKEGNRYLGGNLTNKGTITVNYPTTYEGSYTKHEGKEGTLTNEGTVNIEGVQLTVVGGNTVKNESGKISATGSGLLELEPKTAFTEGAGTTSGTQPVLIKEGALSYTGSGASTIAIRETSTLSGNLAAGQTLNLQGECGEDTRVEASASYTNAGTITLESGTCGSYETLETLAGTLTNTGTITSAIGDAEGSRYLGGNLTNKGTITLDYATTYEGSYTSHSSKEGTLLNEGTIDIEGVQLTVPSGNTFKNESGKIAATGSGLAQLEPGTAFTEGAGTTSGTEPVLIKGSALSYTGAGASTITIRGTSTLSGSLAAGQTLNLQGVCGEDTRVEAAASYTNAGTITLASGTCGAYETLETLAGTLTNTGTITTEVADKEGSRYLGGNLTNKGTITVDYPTTYEGSYTSDSSKEGTLTNEGTIDIEGVQLTVVSGNAVTNAAGTIAASGTGTLYQEGGTFDEAAGSLSGTKPATLQSVALSYTGKGTGKIVLRGTSTLSGPISEGQALVLAGLCGVNTSVTSGSFVNSGTIDFTSESCEPSVRLDLAAGTLENKGTLNIENATGGERAIEGSLVNEKTLYLAGARLDVSGIFKQQGKKAVFETLITSSQYGALTATGAAAITGELEIKQVKNYVPAKGQTYEILKTSALTGTFSKVKKNKIKKSPYSYVPHYSSTGVTLVVEP